MEETRFTQYFLRFLKAVLVHLNEQRKYAFVMNIADKMSSISSNMSLTRKVLRFGRPLSTALSLYKLWVAFLKDKERRKGKQLLYFVIKSIELSVSFVDFLIDHFLWAVRVGVVKKPSWFPTIDFLSDLTWLTGSILGIVLTSLSLIEIQKPPQEGIDPQEAERLRYKYNKEVEEHIFDILKALFDIPISLSTLKPGTFGNGFTGFSGTMGALIGGYQAWPSN